MLVPTQLILAAAALLAPLRPPGSLLAAVPADAYALVHCRDVGALRGRADRNDAYRLLGSAHGEPFLEELAREFRSETHSDMDGLLTLAGALEGEAVFFDTGAVAGFVAEPPEEPAHLIELMRAWMPPGNESTRRTLELGGGSVELVAWPEEIDGWSGRAGHFAAFAVHPWALAIYSGDDSASVLEALAESLTGLGTEPQAPLVSKYRESGGTRSPGIELFVDFTPLVGEAEAALARAVDGALTDPASLLGLQAGTWLHASADLREGTGIDCRARLRLPPETLAAELADTFRPLPNTLPADLPKGIWALASLSWDVGLFYRRARAAYEEAGYTEGLEFVDAGIAAARGMAGVDPVEDVLNQLAGDFTYYSVEPRIREGRDPVDEMEVLRTLGIHVGLNDGDAFLTAFERLIDVGGLESVMDLEEIAGIDAYVAKETDGPGGELDGQLNGGAAFLPRAVTAAVSRRVLERALFALTRVEGASLDGSPMQAAIDGSAGACFFASVELPTLKSLLLPNATGDLRLPPLEDGEPARDPFDARLVSTVHRTPDGFELRLHAR